MLILTIKQKNSLTYEKVKNQINIKYFDTFKWPSKQSEATFLLFKLKIENRFQRTLLCTYANKVFRQ